MNIYTLKDVLLILFFEDIILIICDKEIESKRKEKHYNNIINNDHKVNTLTVTTHIHVCRGLVKHVYTYMYAEGYNALVTGVHTYQTSTYII